MIQYFKFRQDLFDPVPAREAYFKRRPGRGWPEECPPLRAGNSFGFDLLANFEMTFLRQRDGGWRVEPDIVLESDFEWSGSDDPEAPSAPLRQQQAFFWPKGQTVPHVITDDVWKELRNQVKVCTYLYLKTDPNEVLLMTEVPNLLRPYRTMTAVVDTDWYPASYPWHTVLQLDPREKKIVVPRGEPICRVIPVRRDTYFARPMLPAEFDAFFESGQQWVKSHARGPADEEGTVDIQGGYVREQMKSKFVVLK